MDLANVYVDTALVINNASFQRLPVVGEFVGYQGQWHIVTMVGHDWQASGLSRANVTIKLPAASLLVAVPAADPGTHPFPGSH